MFENIDIDAFNKAFIELTSKISGHTNRRIVAVDGKKSRVSHDGKKKAIYLVNTWLDENDVILGQLKTSEKSNEIKAIHKLLNLLFLK